MADEPQSDKLTLTPQEKQLTWNLYMEAMSGTPTVAIPGCRQLVAILISSTIKLGATEYEDSITRCYVMAGRAHSLYYKENDIDQAMAYCGQIATLVTPIITEPAQRYATVKSDLFRYSEGANTNV